MIIIRTLILSVVGVAVVTATVLRTPLSKQLTQKTFFNILQQIALECKDNKIPTSLPTVFGPPVVIEETRPMLIPSAPLLPPLELDFLPLPHASIPGPILEHEHISQPPQLPPLVISDFPLPVLEPKPMEVIIPSAPIVEKIQYVPPAPQLPPFTMPELPISLITRPMVPETTSTVVLEEIKPHLDEEHCLHLGTGPNLEPVALPVIPKAPELSPLYLADLPKPVIPSLIMEQHEPEILTPALPELPALPEFLAPVSFSEQTITATPELMFDIKGPVIEEDIFNPLIIPTAPQLPSLHPLPALPEITPTFVMSEPAIVVTEPKDCLEKQEISAFLPPVIVPLFNEPPKPLPVLPKAPELPPLSLSEIKMPEIIISEPPREHDMLIAYDEDITPLLPDLNSPVLPSIESPKVPLILQEAIEDLPKFRESPMIMKACDEPRQPIEPLIILPNIDPSLPFANSCVQRILRERLLPQIEYILKR